MPGSRSQTLRDSHLSSIIPKDKARGANSPDNRSNQRAVNYRSNKPTLLGQSDSQHQRQGDKCALDERIPNTRDRPHHADFGCMDSVTAHLALAGTRFLQSDNCAIDQRPQVGLAIVVGHVPTQRLCTLLLIWIEPAQNGRHAVCESQTLHSLVIVTPMRKE